MRRTRLLPLGLLLVLLVALGGPPAPGAAQQEGIIQGTLVNRTPGGASVANQEVTLNTYVGTQERGQTSTRSDGQGRFEFAGLSTASNYSYALTLVYQEAEYGVGPRSFDQETNLLLWEVPVYDATSRPDHIRIGRGHLILDVRENTLVVLQFFSFQNTGDKTFVGSRPITPDGKKETIRLSLPTGATQVAAEEGLDERSAFRTDDGISDTLAVAPGGRDIVLSYQLPYKSSAVYLDLPLYYPVDVFNLLVASGKARVSSPQLQPQEAVDMGGQKYLHFSGRDLPPDAELSIDLTNLPQKGFLEGRVDANTLQWSGLGLALLAIAFLVAYSLRRRPAVAAQVTPGRQPDRREALLREIAELDDRFAAGQIEADAYERVRDEKKRRLIELLGGHEEDQG